MLCYRCEHRARFLDEGKHRPRFECGEVETSKSGCYMYKPCKPMILQKDKQDKRPLFGPAMFSSRGYFKRYPEMVLTAKKYKDGYMIYWIPKESKNVKRKK